MNDPDANDPEASASSTASTCPSCTSTWKPTRRSFIRTTAVLAAGTAIVAVLPAAAMAGVGDPPLATAPIMLAAEATPTPYGACEQLRDSCLENCNNNTELNDLQKTICRVMCQAEYAACLAQQANDAAKEAIQTGVDWLNNNAGTVLGTIIIVGVIVLVVVAIVGTGGGAAVVFA